MPIKKTDLAGSTWDTFIKILFHRYIKKNFLGIHGATWDTSIKRISLEL